MGVFGTGEDTHFELMYSRSFACKNRCRKFWEYVFLRDGD